MDNSLNTGVLSFLAAGHDVLVPLHGPILNCGAVSERPDAVLWVKCVALVSHFPRETKSKRRVEHALADLHRELYYSFSSSV